MNDLKGHMLMCKPAVQIQENWKPENTDIFVNEDGIIPVFQRDYIWDVDIIRRIKQSYIWLPTQYQLQQMVKPQNSPDICLISMLFKFIKDNNKDNILHNLSMEQLWLAFVMKEKFNKLWGGKKWQ